jgi:predicted SnoaL-like aldol condensation-catalyzing enzyme
MTRTTPEHNKALVLEAFDTLFNKRDYGAFERYWSPNYLQHSAHIGPGRDGLLNLVKSLPPELKYELEMIVAEGDLPTFKGVWYAAVNFALLVLRDTRPDQCLQPHR